MPDEQHSTTSGQRTRDTVSSGSRRWRPIYDEFRLSHPEDWLCPCGTLRAGNKTCPKCGRVPMDHVAKPKPEAIRMRQARRFAKVEGGR